MPIFLIHLCVTHLGATPDGSHPERVYIRLINIELNFCKKFRVLLLCKKNDKVEEIYNPYKRVKNAATAKYRKYDVSLILIYGNFFLIFLLFFFCSNSLNSTIKRVRESRKIVKSHSKQSGENSIYSPLCIHIN